ncbi:MULTISPECIES: hypothetical protein [unclassified Campylobacter]|nr:MULTISPECIES: hypothetical protein [unclassified Campylobacter]
MQAQIQKNDKAYIKEFLEAIKEAKDGKTTRWDSVQAFAKAMNV